MLTPDRWPQVERIYHAALSREESERASFVRQACSGDAALLSEVESLIGYDSGIQQFLSTPVLEILSPRFIRSPRVVAGQRLGPYEVTSLLGSGGMGDVYRARDTKLGRDVAIKMLPDVFAEDSQHRARLEQEARLLAALNHPHIGAIYGFEDRDGVHALVLELVEGQTLAQRIREGPLPLREALTIARQVADALHAAHSKGIIHRDLKPANIALSRDGSAKVLDFGLAKSIVTRSLAAESAAGTRGTSVDDSSADVVLGTVAFMSPEQVRGKAVDRRADIWAFGCVVWAMLTGRTPFGGDSVPDTIDAILAREPDWPALGTTPPIVVRLLRRCLDKDAQRRADGIADVRSEIDRALEAESAGPRPSVRGGVLSAALVSVPVVLVIILGGLVSNLVPPSPTSPPSAVAFTQLTNFTDSAVAPAVSPDGRMVAFIRGEKSFLSTGPIYVKALPDGEAVELTRDSRPKYGLAFSPDGSRIVYSITGSGWSTYSIPVRGGEPTLLLSNAAGLTWLDRSHLLFSEIRTGLHMGIVTASENRADSRVLYFPEHERSMAHYSFPSPDRRWALIVEMDNRPVWQPCRLIPLDGSSPGRLVGPTGRCSSAGWSPDGAWMYFSAEVDQQYHLWRQRFPDGAPEQLTFGPAQEEGVAVAPDGSLVTSVGMEQSSIWIHDSLGDRQLSSEGEIVGPQGFLGFYLAPSFSPDASRLTYLRREALGSTAELWHIDLRSGNSGPLLPGIAMVEYDVSRDGSQAVFSVQPAGKPSELWLARLDRSSPARRIASTGETSPYFGPTGEVLFRFTDGRLNYLGRMNTDGSTRQKVVDYPIATFRSISPDRRWLVAITPYLDGSIGSSLMAIPTAGGAPRQLCPAACYHAWSPDGGFLYVQVAEQSRTSAGRMVALPILRETGLPDLPDTGIASEQQATAIRGSRVVNRGVIVPGLDHETYAYVNRGVHRNLFRIPPSS